MLEERRSETSARREVERVTSNGTCGWAAVVRVGSKIWAADAAGINSLQQRGGDTHILFEREEEFLTVNGARHRVVTNEFVSDFIAELRQRAPRAKLLRRELRVSQPHGTIDGYAITERFDLVQFWIEDVRRRIDLGYVPTPETTSFVAVGRAGITATSKSSAEQAVSNLKIREGTLIERMQTMIGAPDAPVE